MKAFSHLTHLPQARFTWNVMIYDILLFEAVCVKLNRILQE
jgi:hypothetical protein